MDSCSCSPQNTSFYDEKKEIEKASKNPEFAKMRHGDVILTLAVSLKVSFLQAGMGMEYRIITHG